jgi:hypothetical protein
MELQKEVEKFTDVIRDFTTLYTVSDCTNMYIELYQNLKVLFLWV